MNWISVNERLPEVFDEVLVSELNDDRSYLGYYLNTPWDEEVVHWYTSTAVRINATHWMPLPPPPKD